MEFRLGEITPLQILMRDATDGLPKATVTPSVVKLVKAGGAIATLTSGVDFTWAELDATNMKGLYRFTPLTDVLTTTEGDCVLYVNAVACIPTARGYTVKPLQYSFDEVGAYTEPRLISVVPAGRKSLTLTFSEPVVMDATVPGALRVANYTLDHGATVSAVTQVDDRTVTLTTSARTVGLTYILTVSNVEDLDGNVVVN